MHENSEIFVCSENCGTDIFTYIYLNGTVYYLFSWHFFD